MRTIPYADKDDTPSCCILIFGTHNFSAILLSLPYSRTHNEKGYYSNFVRRRF